MSQMSRDDVRERLGNIDQIRDIIFGAQIRDYDNRLSKMESDISKLHQEMRSNIEQLKISFTTELKVSVEGLDKKIKSLTLNTEEEAADLRSLVDRLNKKFTSNIQSLDEALDAQSSSSYKQLGEVKEQLQEDITALRDLVLEELERRFSDLRENKVSRDDMAESLFALGMRLKGAEIIPKLHEASDVKNEYNGIPLLETAKLPKVLTS
ncbi:MAG: hypothetical protein HC908_07040 [Calothrix sp. SM1_7_51]|nr:hypothetical protein [Calothrix sp. SM1_7_51]